MAVRVKKLKTRLVMHHPSWISVVIITIAREESQVQPQRQVVTEMIVEGSLQGLKTSHTMSTVSPTAAHTAGKHHTPSTARP